MENKPILKMNWYAITLILLFFITVGSYIYVAFRPSILSRSILGIAGGTFIILALVPEIPKIKKLVRKLRKK